MEVKELSEKIKAFRAARGWQNEGAQRDIAISIAIEAGELLEHFQWWEAKESCERNFQGIKEELADVLIYGFTLADMLHVDVEDIIAEKLEINKTKYPDPEQKAM